MIWVVVSLQFRKIDWVPKLDFEFCNARMWSWLSGEDMQMTLSLVSRDIGNSVAFLRMSPYIGSLPRRGGYWERHVQIFQHVASDYRSVNFGVFYSYFIFDGSRILGFWCSVLSAHFSTSLSWHLSKWSSQPGWSFKGAVCPGKDWKLIELGRS